MNDIQTRKAPRPERKPKMKEEELASYVVAWLKENDWTVYQEVAALGKVCDIVATKADRLWCIECKTSLGLAVIGQAYNWIPHANMVSVATPRTKTPNPFADKVLLDYGIGHLSVLPKGALRFGSIVSEQIFPKAMATKTNKIKLCEEQKDYAPAGNAHGNRFTPFKKTVIGIGNYLSEHGNTDLKTVIKNIDHHYASDASARNSIREAIFMGHIKTIAVRSIKGKPVLFLRSDK